MTIKLILIEGTSENIKLIKEQPKQLKHLRVLARHHFGVKAIDSKFVVLYKDEQIMLDSEEYSLKKFYEKGKLLTIYVKPTEFLKKPVEHEKVVDDDWDLVGTTCSQFSNNNAHSPEKIINDSIMKDDSRDKNEDLSRLQEESMISNIERKMPSEMELDQKFKENELYLIGQTIKEEYETKIGEMDIHFTALLDNKEKILEKTLKEIDKAENEKKWLYLELEKNKQDLKFMEEAYDNIKNNKNKDLEEKNSIINELKKLKTFDPKISICENVKKLNELQQKLNLDLNKITFQLDQKSLEEKDQKSIIESLKEHISKNENELKEMKNKVKKYQDYEKEIKESIHKVESKNRELNDEISKINEKYETDISAAFIKAQELKQVSDKQEHESKIAEDLKNKANDEINRLKSANIKLEDEKIKITDQIKVLEQEIEIINNDFSSMTKIKDEKQKNYEAELKEFEHQNDVIEKEMLDKLKIVKEKDIEIQELKEKLNYVNGLNSLLDTKVTEITERITSLEHILKSSTESNEEQKKNIKTQEGKINQLKKKEEEFLINISNQEKIISANNWEILQYKNQESQFEILNKNFSYLKEEKSMIQSKLEQEKEKNLALKDVIKFRDIDLLNQIDDLTKQKSELETKILDIEEKQTENEKETLNLRNQLDIKNQEINDHKEELKYSYQSNLEKLSEKDMIIKEYENAKNKTQESFLQVEDEKKRASSFEESFNTASKKLEEYETQIKTIEEKLNLKIKEASNLSQENKTVKAAYEELRQAMTNIQDSTYEINNCNKEIKKKDEILKLKEEDIKNKEKQISELKNSIKDIEFNQSQISVISEENMKELKEEIHLQEKQQFIENEADLTSMFKERETMIRKYFEEIKEKDNKRIKAAEKKVEMYKNMLKSLKNKNNESANIPQDKALDNNTLNMASSEANKTLYDRKNSLPTIMIENNNLISEKTISKLKLRISQIEINLSESKSIKNRDVISVQNNSLENYRKLLLLIGVTDINNKENIDQIIENLLSEVQNYCESLVVKERIVYEKQQNESQNLEEQKNKNTLIEDLKAKNETCEKEFLQVQNIKNQNYEDSLVLINKINQLNEILMNVRESLNEEKKKSEELQTLLSQSENEKRILLERINDNKVDEGTPILSHIPGIIETKSNSEKDEFNLKKLVDRVTIDHNHFDNTSGFNFESTINLENEAQINDSELRNVNNLDALSHSTEKSLQGDEKPKNENHSSDYESSCIFTKTDNNDPFFTTNNNEINLDKQEIQKLRFEIDKLTAENLELSNKLEDEKKKSSDIENTFQETQIAYENSQRSNDHNLAQQIQEYEEKMHKNQDEFNKKLKEKDDVICNLNKVKKNGMNSPKNFVKDIFKTFVGNNIINQIPEKHDRIVCDSCYKCPIIGDRYKCLTRHGYDLCSDCYNIKDNYEPFIQFRTPSKVSHERFEDMLPYLQIIIREIKEGKLQVIYND